MHVIARRGVFSIALAGCGGDNASTNGSSSSGEGTSALTSLSSGMTGTDPTTSTTELATSEGEGVGSSSTAADSSTTGETGIVWPEPELLALLEGDPLVLEPWFITIAGDYVHVGAAVVGTQSQHWVLDRQSGRLASTSPAGGNVVATASSVYSAGYRTGDSADGELAVVRMNYDGTNEVELLVTTDIPFAFASSSTTSYFQFWPSYDHFEIWTAEDGSPNLELLLDTDQQDMGRAIYRDGGLLAPASDSNLVLRLDLDALAFEPLLAPEEAATVLGSTSALLLVGTDESLFRADARQLELEHVDDGRVTQIAADEASVFWLSSYEPIVLKTTPTSGGPVDQIPLGDDLLALRSIATTPDSVYILVAGVDEAGSVWRLPRPE